MLVFFLLFFVLSFFITRLTVCRTANSNDPALNAVSVIVGLDAMILAATMMPSVSDLRLGALS